MLCDTNARCGASRAASDSAATASSSWAYVSSGRSDMSTRNGRPDTAARPAFDSRRLPRQAVGASGGSGQIGGVGRHQPLELSDRVVDQPLDVLLRLVEAA